MRDRFGHPGRDAQICGHAVQGVDKVFDFVVACGLDVLIEIAVSDSIGQRDGAPEASADAERQEHAGDDADQKRGDRSADEELPSLIISRVQALLGLLHKLVLDLADLLDPAHNFPVSNPGLPPWPALLLLPNGSAA